MHNSGTQQDPARQDGSELASAGPERRKSRRDTKRKSSRESKKLQRDPEKRDKRRTYSFSPGRNDSIRVARASDRPPVPAIPLNLKGKGRAFTEKEGSAPAGTKPLRASTQPPENTQDWQRMPTLHKRSAQELARRKSSKKRKGDHDREAEIKAMVAFMPTRPAADVNSSGRPMKRETIRGGKVVRNSENQSSDVSLPLAESLRSSTSGHSEPQTSFVVSGFDMLAPRPTIRYSENPRYVPGASGFGSTRSDSKRKLSDRVPMPEETLKANKRVDDLADDLSAGELRELMERDEKRREKKKIAERIKIERRLARRQEKQRAEETEAARQGTPPPSNMERGVLGREVVGLGIGTSAVVTSSKRKSSAGSDDGRGIRPAAESFRQDSTISAHDPFADLHRSASQATENFTPGSERSDPVIETATVGTVGKASVSPTIPAAKGHTRGQSSISQMMDLTQSEAPQPSTIPEPTMQPAAARAKTPSSWTSFFKLRGAKKRHTPPSSFSNTSRDSMHVGQASQIGYTPMRSTSNIPKRTMSKFREDLPELPISPPDSRVQSPEADIVPPIRTDYAEKRTGVRASSDDPRVRYDTPTSGYRSLDATRLPDETPTSGHRSTDAPSPEHATIISQSLASIDSEGSWLSGRRAGSKRGSSQLTQHAPIRDSSSSLNKKYKEFSESAEELGIAEDEYFSRLSPGPEESYKIQRRSGNPMPSSDDEEGGSISSPITSEKWGAVGRQPTVVHREPRAKSREGLLNDFDDDDDSGSEMASSPVDAESNRESGLQRATSVDLGKNHVRHISAGSARLLDLKPRSSVDSRRDS
ncbi:uncharacterized protein LY89DRAFT_544741, partial [Mollisia scopiformis]